MEIRENKAHDAYGDENYSEESVISVLDVVTDKFVMEDGSNLDTFFELLLDNRFPSLIISCGEHNYQKCGKFSMDQGPYTSTEITDADDIRTFISEMRRWCDNAENVMNNLNQFVEKTD